MKNFNFLFRLSFVLISVTTFAQPNPPTGVTASDGTYTDKIHISWNSVSGVSGYDIYRGISNSSSSSSKIASTSNSLLEMDDTGVSPATTYYYWVKSKIIVGGNVTQSGFSNSDAGWLQNPTEVDEEQLSLSFNLFQNYPNPFNPTILIKYSLPYASYVNLTVYNLLGEQVAVLANTFKQAGVYEIKFDGSSLQSGIYYYRIMSNNISETKKLVLVK